MPRVISTCEATEMTLEDCVEEIASLGFDPNSEESVATCAKALQRLTNNRNFLGDILIDRLKHHDRDDPIDSAYGPQAIVLSPLRGNTFLRANIWPSERDHCFRASGAETFVYGIPHDHNFSFLTSGYLGPGYRSDYFEYDYANTAGYVGERPGIRFVERSALHEGKLMLYRAHKDIHSQIPPESLSVSLNLMHIDPAQHWYDQYGFDLQNGSISRVLSPNATEAFLRVAVATGLDEAQDLAEHFGKSHPSDRLRLASYEARSLQLKNESERDALWSEAERSGSRMLEATAKAYRKGLELA